MNIYIIVFAVYLVVLLVFGSIAAKRKKKLQKIFLLLAEVCRCGWLLGLMARVF